MVDISPRATRISKRKDFLGVVSFLFMDRRVCRSTAPQSDVGGKSVYEFAYYRRIQRGRACMSQAATEGCRGGPMYYLYIKVTDVCVGASVCACVRWSRAGSSVISSLPRYGCIQGPCACTLALYESECVSV